MRNMVKLDPIISEKALALSEQGVYIFDVTRAANKIEIAEAVEAQFEVSVKHVRTVNLHGKPKQRRTKTRVTTGRTISRKKAYVTLNEGSKITLFGETE